MPVGLDTTLATDHQMPGQIQWPLCLAVLILVAYHVRGQSGQPSMSDIDFTLCYGNGHIHRE